MVKLAGLGQEARQFRCSSCLRVDLPLGRCGPLGAEGAPTLWAHSACQAAQEPLFELQKKAIATRLAFQQPFLWQVGDVVVAGQAALPLFKARKSH